MVALITAGFLLLIYLPFSNAEDLREQIYTVLHIHTRFYLNFEIHSLLFPFLQCSIFQLLIRKLL